MASDTLAMLEYFVIKIVEGCRAAAPKGLMAYALIHMRYFLILLGRIW